MKVDVKFKDLTACKEVEFGKNLRELRTTAGLTQTQLADVIGASRGTIAHYESYVIAPTFGRLIALAKALNTTVDSFITYED